MYLSYVILDLGNILQMNDSLLASRRNVFIAGQTFIIHNSHMSCSSNGMKSIISYLPLGKWAQWHVTRISNLELLCWHTNIPVTHQWLPQAINLSVVNIPPSHPTWSMVRYNWPFLCISQRGCSKNEKAYHVFQWAWQEAGCRYLINQVSKSEPWGTPHFSTTSRIAH